MPNNIEQSARLLNESDKEFINSQTRLYVSKLNAEVTAKLRHTNETSMRHPKVSEILQLENFIKYPHLQKALSWRYQVIDQQKWSNQQKQFYKQILLAKAILSVSLRNMGEQTLAKEIDFSAVNAQNFQKAVQNKNLQSQIFSGSYLKCLHAFQKITQNDEWATISKRSKVDAILWYRTVQQLLSYSHYQVSKPVQIDSEYRREYTTWSIDYSDTAVMSQTVRNLQTIYPLTTITLSQAQYILQSLNKYAANTSGELVDNVINPYRKQLIDRMLQIGASQSSLGVVQNINNIKSTIDSSIDMQEFEKIGKQYYQDHLKNKSEQSPHQKNPYLAGPFNPRNYINPQLTKRWDQLFHKWFDIDNKMEQYLYGQKRWDPQFWQGITYTVMKDGILNMPDDILMFVWDVVALWAATVSGQWLLLKYLWARRNADSSPQAAQDLTWMVEAHPMLGLLNILSWSTIKSLGSQLWTIMQGKWTAKEIWDFINMVGWLVVGVGGVIKIGGKMVQFGSKIAKSERVSRVAQKISKVWSKVADVGSRIDPANIALSGAGVVIWATADVVKWSKPKKSPKSTEISWAKAPETSTKKLKDKILEKMKPITSESELVVAQRSLNQEIIRWALSAEEIGRRLGYFVAQFVDLFKSGTIKSKELVTKTYLWIKAQYTKFKYKISSQDSQKLHELNTQVASMVDDVVQTTLTSSEWRALQLSLHDLQNTQKSLDFIISMWKLTDSWRWFEWLLSSVPVLAIKRIPVLNLLPIEAATNLIYFLIQRKHAQKIGMSIQQINKMMRNQIKDASISITSSAVNGVTWWRLLWPLSPIPYIFGLGDLAYRANIKNAQEFLHFYGQQIEGLKQMNVDPKLLKLHEEKLSKLAQNLDLKIKESKKVSIKTKEITRIEAIIAQAKNTTELKVLIMKHIPETIRDIDVWWQKVNLTKKQIWAAIDAYLSWQTNQLRNIPKAYWLQDAVQRLSKAKTTTSQTAVII